MVVDLYFYLNLIYLWTNILMFLESSVENTIQNVKVVQWEQKEGACYIDKTRAKTGSLWYRLNKSRKRVCYID